jgi:hypothetical protein
MKIKEFKKHHLVKLGALEALNDRLRDGELTEIEANDMYDNLVRIFFLE